jgi:hypothetical protein
MSNRNEVSSLVALRELRDMERQRLDEADANRRSVDPGFEVARLRGELELAHAQNARLRDELERAAGLAAARISPSPRRLAGGQWFGWLGLSAGASMLVGALALSAAMRSPAASPPAAPSLPIAPAVVCAGPEPSAPAPTVTVAAAPTKPHASKASARPRPRHPATKQPPTAACDGSDPLCGLPIGTIDDVGTRRGKGGRAP